MKKYLALAIALIAMLAMLTMGVSATDTTTPTMSQADLVLAISQVADGGTVTLTGNVALNSTLNITKNVTIDGGSETKYGITYTGSDSAILIALGQTVFLKNLSITAEDGVAVQVYSKGAALNLTIDTCTLTAEQPIYIGGWKIGDGSMYSYNHNVTVTGSTLTATEAVLTFQSSTAPNASGTYGGTVVASTVAIDGSELITKGSLVQFDENGSSNCSGLQDISITNCTIDMPTTAYAISADHSSVQTAGTFYCELKMDDSTLAQVPGVAYGIGANGGLVVNIHDLADIYTSSSKYGKYGSYSGGAWYSFIKTLKLAKDVAVNADVILCFGGASGGACNDASFDLNGHTLTLNNGAVLTIRGNNVGYQSVIDSSTNNIGGIATDATAISKTPQLAATNTVNGNISIDVDVLDEYTGVLLTGIYSTGSSKYFVLTGDTSDVATVNRNYSYSYDYGWTSGTTYVDDTYSIFGGDGTVYEEAGASYSNFTVAFTNLPVGFKILNSTGDSWTFTVNGESVTLADGETYTVAPSGDVNGDGSIDTADILLILQIATGAVDGTAYFAEADMNMDGKVNSLDAYALYQKL